MPGNVIWFIKTQAGAMVIAPRYLLDGAKPVSFFNYFFIISEFILIEVSCIMESIGVRRRRN